MAAVSRATGERPVIVSSEPAPNVCRYARDALRAGLRWGLAAGVLAAGVLALGTTMAAGAAGAQIKSLDCASTPEVVAITNTGAETQVMTGWKLVSDPPDQQSFDLGSIGALSPGETVFIESGPGATGAFIWSKEEVFRDGDATDYARLVSAEGVFFDEVHCTAASAPMPTMGAIPDGGGPPGPAADGSVPLLAVGVGSAMATLGMVAVVTGLVARAPRRIATLVAGRTTHPVTATSRVQGSTTRRGDSGVEACLALAALWVIAAAILEIVSRFQSGRR